MTASGALAVGFADAFPLSSGPTLVVPRRHEPDFFALTIEEQVGVLALANDLRRQLREELSFDGVNLCVNAGIAAGQTIGHAHLHLVPRSTGDVADPSGDIRWVLPEGANYWGGTP